ncbi:lectin [Catenulispora subtropica]|uniref:Ricin-type beta-trefoil lectin domain protein n=1 Tax=Catenulispora subtropica TaxID=450798 RepID=A0ABP5CS78_9ACTN
MRRRSKQMRLTRLAAALVTVVTLLLGTMSALQPAAAAGNPYQRGPDPTVASVAATSGPFATAQLSVPPGNGFNGGMIYYPTDTSLGTWGAVAIVPGYTALFANEEAWMGPWLASFGFVVIGVETNSRTDYDVARGTQLLAALDYLTQQSPVRSRVDPNRLGVIGHSMGGGGVVYATEHRPALKAAVALAPFSPSQTMATDSVPTMVMGGQNDTVVTPSYLSGLYATMPAATQSDFLQIAGADHVYYTHPNSVEMRILIPWIKTFIDDDTRYTQFLCPGLADPTGVSIYQSKCPYVPGGSTPPPTGGELHAVGAGKCLDVPNSSTTGGTQVQIYSCSGAANQVFTHTSSGQLTVTEAGTTLCLDANAKGTTNGTKVIIWSCNGQTNQQWNLNADGTITGVQSGLCLDVNGASTANGALVQLWTCNGQTNQQWTLG